MEEMALPSGHFISWNFEILEFWNDPARRVEIGQNALKPRF